MKESEALSFETLLYLKIVLCRLPGGRNHYSHCTACRNLARWFKGECELSRERRGWLEAHLEYEIALHGGSLPY